MRLEVLNLACGQKFDNLTKHIKTVAPSTDIFCFQELLFGSKPEFTPIRKARVNLFEELEHILVDCNPYIYKAPESARYFYHELLPEGVQGGLAIFAKKTVQVGSDGGFRCYKWDNFPRFDFGAKLTGNCQWIEAGEYTIMNLHGIYQRDTNKADTPERMVQAIILKDFMNEHTGKLIIGGDFNLLPENESLKLIEGDMVNLVNKYKVETTRSSDYAGAHNKADYILVSPDVKVKDFAVVDCDVSDHLPMVLDISI